jgi:hypothetical protein
MKSRFFLTAFFVGGLMFLLPAQRTERTWDKIIIPNEVNGVSYVKIVVMDIAIDKSGTKWLATFSGDGHEGIGGFKYVEPNDWTAFVASGHEHHVNCDSVDDDDDTDDFGEEIKDEISASNNNSVAVDWWGNVWFGSAAHGVCRFKPSDNTWRQITCISGLTKSNTVKDIITIKDTIWFATDSGINLLIRDSLQPEWRPGQLAKAGVNCLAVDLSGNIWAGTTKGLSKYNGASWGTLSTPASSTSSENHVDAFAVDAHGNVWAAIYHKGIYVYNGTSWSKHEKFEDCSGDKYTYITCLAFDKKGHLWAGCATGGVWEYDGSTWTKYTKEGGFLCDNRVQSIAVDNKDGAVWIGSIDCLTKVYDKPLSVFNIDGYDNIKVYPNPVQNKCTVTHVEDATVEIYTVAGQKTGTYYSVERDITIDTGVLPSGLYMLKIMKNNQTKFFKISVVH